MLDPPFEALDEETFTQPHSVYLAYRYCRYTIENLIRRAAFLFRTGTYAQLFAILILGVESFNTALAGAGINVEDDWCRRAREYDLRMYADRIHDNRPAHEIQETFLNLRKFFRGLQAGARYGLV